MKHTKIGTIAAVLILFIIAAITNPSLETHKTLLKEKLYKKMEDERQKAIQAYQGNMWTESISDFGMTLGKQFTNRIVDQLVYVDNFFFFSITKIDLADSDIIIGVGFFGTVMFFSNFNDINLNSAAS
ncbi:MAG: hypothetical protein RIS47_2246 [Bacteroidota bacterium]|jgi:hypothetical protein